MSTVKSQTELSGLLGEKVSVRKVNGRIVVTNRPNRKLGPPSGKQEAVQQKFLEAVNYAKQQLQQEESRSLYEAGITARKKSALIVAITDYLNAPRVDLIETGEYQGNIGDKIQVKAVDDFKVAAVKIVITDSDGNILEKGEAEADLKLYHWNYVAKVANPSVAGTRITATAFDRPGNKGQLEKAL
jgi:hypothetical protein